VRGRKPKPTALKAVLNAKLTPRDRFGQAQPARLPKAPAPPATLSQLESEIWCRQAPVFVALGLLTSVDLPVFRQLVGVAAELEEIDRFFSTHEKSGIARFILKGSKEQPTLNVLVKHRNELRSLLCRLASEFGASPSSRVRASTAPMVLEHEDPADKFFDFD
jgi:phage terminase small subunit